MSSSTNVPIYTVQHEFDDGHDYPLTTLVLTTHDREQAIARMIRDYQRAPKMTVWVSEWQGGECIEQVAVIHAREVPSTNDPAVKRSFTAADPGKE